MKSLKTTILEKLILAKNNKRLNKVHFPKTGTELYHIIENKVKANPESIDVSDIEIEGVDNLSQIFKNFKDLKEIIGLETWNTSGVTSMTEMFMNCSSLQYVNLSNWDVSNTLYFRSMFMNCNELETVGDISDWEINSKSGNDIVVDMSAMFANCYKLESVDMTSWNTENVHWFSHVFCNCKKIESVGDLSNLNLKNNMSLTGLFKNCHQLKSIGDISNWNLSRVVTMANTFEGCNSLIRLGNIGKWNMTKILDIESIFNGCTKLCADVSNWKIMKRCKTTNAFKYTDRKIFKKCKIL